MVNIGYENATSCIKLHENTKKFRIGRGVRQGDTISPKLFTSSLESVFKKLDWSKMGININGKYLSHLRFADDIVLMTVDLNEAQIMLQQLNEESSQSWSQDELIENENHDKHRRRQRHQNWRYHY